jgi:hypothetical protein
MTTDQGKIFCGLTLALCLAAIILLAASGCREFGAYASIVGVLSMSIFVGMTLDA